MKNRVVNGITTGYEWNSCTKMNIHAIRMENRSFCSQRRAPSIEVLGSTKATPEVLTFQC